MRRLHLLGLAILIPLVWLTPLRAQDADSEWRLEGIRTAFCIQLLLDPSSDAVRSLPSGVRPLAASQAKDLHPSLRDLVSGQSAFASWAPSRLCFDAVDTIRGQEFASRGKRDRPQLFGYWTVLTQAAGGQGRDFLLDLYTTSGRLSRAAEQMGQRAREIRLRIGKVPTEDENGVPSTDDRFEVKVGKTLITWDGRLASDTAQVTAPITVQWAYGRDGSTTGEMTLRPVYARPMVGAIKVDGKDDFAKALRASPTRFAGPAYQGGSAVIRMKR
jgi:hypothetical protein